MDATKIQEARRLANALRICADDEQECTNCPFYGSDTECISDKTRLSAADMIDAMATELESALGLTRQLDPGQQNPNTTAEAELLHTLCTDIAQRQNPWDVCIMDQLLAAWDAGAVIADPLTVALLAPKLEWAKKHLGEDPYLADELYARLLLTVIPAICPELAENEEEAEPNDGND